MPDTLLQPIFVLLWSSGYVVGALASQVSGPVPLLATRFILASLVTVPAALHTGGFRARRCGGWPSSGCSSRSFSSAASTAALPSACPPECRRS